MCLGAIYWARPARIFYAATAADAATAGFDDAFIYEEIRRSPDARRLLCTQTLGEEALGPFRVWAAYSDKKPY
jgi:tRNA(Arg) A34 adenosine deaminase TadA